MNEKLQYIKSKVVEVCPEVMGLSFGCRLLTPSKKVVSFIGYKENMSTVGVGFLGQVVEKTPATKWTTICITEKQGLYYYNFNDKNKILGHPITLSHILRTIGQKAIFMHNPPTSVAKFLRSNQEDLPIEKWGTEWNLKKDSLDQQKPEVIDFLYTLLK